MSRFWVDQDMLVSWSSVASAALSSSSTVSGFSSDLGRRNSGCGGRVL